MTPPYVPLRSLPFIYAQPLPAQNFADLKKQLILQGQNYAAEALTYRKKIAELAFGFIKDGSVVSLQNSKTTDSFCMLSHQILTHSYSRVVMQTLLLAHKRKRISGTFALNFTGDIH
jgi:translation initiation factor eIF-2B subunit alpha